MQQGNQFRVREQDKQRALAYFATHWREYGQQLQRGPLKAFRERERDAVLRLADFQSGETMLDVGCGNGLYALEAKRRGMWVCAVDAVPEMVASIPSAVDEVHVADVENFRPGDQYDRVICAGVLDFVREPKRAFLNLCRLVAPGGKLVILVPRIGIAGLFYRFAKLRLGIRVNLYSVAWFRRVSVETEVSVNSWSCPLPHNIAMLLTHSDLRAPPSVSCRARDSAIKK